MKVAQNVFPRLRGDGELTFDPDYISYPLKGHFGGVRIVRGFGLSFPISVLERYMAGILASLTHELTITEYSDWLVFVERLNEAVRAGRVRNVPVVKRVWSSDEEWFLDPESGEVYIYVSPNPPSMPIWEKVDVLGHLEAPDPAPLSGFKVGHITVMTAHIMKMSLETLVSRGLVEVLPSPVEVLWPKDRTERWYKDNVTNVVYRLIEHYRLEGADDIRWEAVPKAELSGKIQ